MNLYWILVSCYLLFALWALYYVIIYGERPTKSIAWVFALFTLPFLGAALYYLFGINRRKFKFYQLRKANKKKLESEYEQILEHTHDSEEFNDPHKKKLAQLIQKTCGQHAVQGNQVEILSDGEATFDSIFQTLRKAEHSIHLQYYIFSKGTLADTFYEIFKTKISEGVEVRLIYDSLGSFSFRGKTMKRFKKIGVKAFPMMPLRMTSLLYNINYRNHRKILLVDGKIGFTGGVNVSDKYIKPISKLGIWQDIHLKIEGPVVNGLQRIFVEDYFFAGDKDLLASADYFPAIEKKGGHALQIAASGPDSKYPTILHQYITMIQMAQECIYIANPYFIPGHAIMEAIRIAALSGVEVSLLIPRKGDSKLATMSMFSRFQPLLAAGVKIFLRKDFSHSKMILIDDTIASVGSGNFDYRSFVHNFETNAILYDTDLVGQIKQEFNAICEDIDQLDPQQFKDRGLIRRLGEGFARLLSPLL